MLGAAARGMGAVAGGLLASTYPVPLAHASRALGQAGRWNDINGVAGTGGAGGALASESPSLAAVTNAAGHAAATSAHSGVARMRFWYGVAGERTWPGELTLFAVQALVTFRLVQPSASPGEASTVAAVLDALDRSPMVVGVAGARWEFGDGAAATGLVVSHRFRAEGLYHGRCIYTLGGVPQEVRFSVEAIEWPPHPCVDVFGQGHYYSRREDVPEDGFVILGEWWETFQRVAGIDLLGLPVSGMFRSDGDASGPAAPAPNASVFSTAPISSAAPEAPAAVLPLLSGRRYQTFQGGLLEQVDGSAGESWSPSAVPAHSAPGLGGPELGALGLGAADAPVTLAPIFAQLSAAGLDGWLEAALHVPPVEPGAVRSLVEAEPQASPDERLRWLTNERLAQFYFANPNPVVIGPWSPDHSTALYGLPASHPVRVGPFLIQRFDHVAVQLWLDQVPGLPAPGTVTSVAVGQLLADAGFIPPTALTQATVRVVA